MSGNMQQLKVELTWLIRRHMPEVQSIERQCFEYPWSEDDFIQCLRQRNRIGMVAEVDERIAGFMIYELQLGRLRVLNFAVRPEFRRRGVGTAMVGKLIGKLSLQRRRHLTLEVRETNLDAQLFFQARGFRAVKTLRDFYEDTSEDAYLFEYSLLTVLP